MMIIHTILVDMMRRIVSDCRLTGTTINMKKNCRRTEYERDKKEKDKKSGYKATVIDADGKIIAVLTGTGTFVMPDSDVKIVSRIDETLYAMLASGIENSYVFSYDTDMSLIKTSSTRKKNDYVIIALGEEYMGRTFTIYKGKKSTGTNVTEGVFDADGRFRFEYAGFGKNYTLVVGD